MSTRAAARTRPAHAWFFPPAALYAALIVPLSLYGMLSAAPWLQAISSGSGHAHEMLFGFALAVVAGYLLGPQSKSRLQSLFVLWVGARVAFLAGLPLWISGSLNAGFAAALAALIAPKFLSAAKKLRNQAFAPVLIALCLAVGAFHAAAAVDSHWLQRVILLEAVLLFALLMMFMGGRVIAPAAAGALHLRGIQLQARVQPRIEGALIVLVAAAVVLLAVPGAVPVAAGASIAAGSLSSIRLLRWRLWACHGRPDLICLGIGYGWLGLGLIAVGAALLAGRAPTAALHLLTVGALGTLSTGVMARVRLTRAKLNPAREHSLVLMTRLLAAATLLRVWGGNGTAQNLAAYAAAAAFWSLAYLLLLRLLVRIPAR